MSDKPRIKANIYTPTPEAEERSKGTAITLVCSAGLLAVCSAIAWGKAGIASGETIPVTPPKYTNEHYIPEQQPSVVFDSNADPQSFSNMTVTIPTPVAR